VKPRITVLHFGRVWGVKAHRGEESRSSWLWVEIQGVGSLVPGEEQIGSCDGREAELVDT